MTAAVLLGNIQPGSDEWLKRMSASKIAAVLGLSPWESRFSLWHRMAGLAEKEAENDQHRRGHYLEPAIMAWFADQYPEWDVQSSGTQTFAHAERDWQIASPDGIACATRPVGKLRLRTDNVVALVEAKTAARDEGWGEPGTDQIPVYYRCQVQWQMDVMGVDVCHVALLNDRLTFTEYVVPYNPSEAEYLRDEALDFLNTLPGQPGEQRPDIDAHSATYDVIKSLPDGVIDEAVEIEPLVAERYAKAVVAAKAAEAEKRLMTSTLLDLIGDRKYADSLGERYATRGVKKTGKTHALTPSARLSKDDI